MPKAEVGSTKHLNNQLKSKGLQRLRWYCQVCEKQCRDANGFKCHVASESHVRQMLVVGENSAKYINDYSGQFKRDYLQLLRTSHGEKKINLNHFYQEYIHQKDHIHMNATQWPSLTEFGKYLGREGICRVEEGDKGLEVAWVDNSPEALRRQDAIRKKERQDKGDEEREQRLIAQQVERARQDAEAKSAREGGDEAKELQRADGEKIKLNFGVKPAEPVSQQELSPPASDTPSVSPPTQSTDAAPQKLLTTTDQTKTPTPLSLKLGASKPKNVFGLASKKNAFSGAKPASKMVTQKPMSEAERIMKAELERKRGRQSNFPDPPQKKIRL